MIDYLFSTWWNLAIYGGIGFVLGVVFHRFMEWQEWKDDEVDVDVRESFDGNVAFVTTLAFTVLWPVILAVGIIWGTSKLAIAGVHALPDPRKPLGKAVLFLYEPTDRRKAIVHRETQKRALRR